MLRLFRTQAFPELYRCSHFVMSRVTKRQLTRFLPVCHHQVSILGRHFNSGSPVGKDVPQPPGDKSEETDTIDLDKWKSLMSAKAVSEEKQQVNDEEKEEEEEEEDDDDDDDDDGHLQEPGGQDTSSLGATRDLVVMWRQAGKLVPEEITDEELQELAALTTKSSRKKYLKYLAIREQHKKTRKKKQQKKRSEREAMLEQKKAEDSGAEKWNNTFLLQYWHRSLDRLLSWRSAQAMQFNQPLVFDMSYEANMSRQEIANTVQQLMEVEGWNRRVSEPYHLHFCNLREDGAYMKELLKRYGADTWDHLLITCSDRQHVDLFPREQLVYLTSDSHHVLHTYDHSKVYIIGALVDRSIQSGLSMANAKRLNLATARLPLDEYLNWEMGSKNLTLDQMIRIMVTLKDTGNWEKALKFVPKRKHDGNSQQQIKKLIINDRDRGATYRRAEEKNHRPLRSGERITGSTFKKADQSFYRHHKDRSFTSRDRKKMWWDDA